MRKKPSASITANRIVINPKGKPSEPFTRTNMKQLLCIALLLIFTRSAQAQSLIATKGDQSGFPVAAPAGVAAIYVDATDDWLANKTASLLQADLEKITGKKPELLHSLSGKPPRNLVIIGTVNGSATLKQLAAAKKLDLASLSGKWEAYQLQTLKKPMPGVDNALVIAGSDKRGAAYGVFELSRQMGVSPWWYWADVPAQKKETIFVIQGIHKFASPSVKYRGIFINDEAPAFSGWTKEKFGGVNHQVYEKVFELLLRLRGNYLWPAMWGNAFNDDDTLNPVLADKWGIVMGTSHHEPMLRAQQEWKRYGKGAWDYTKNDTVLRDFWRKGLQNMGSHESIITVGMRGDGDEPMTRGTATELLERIVKDQRQIITEVTGKPANKTPQLWALYKEVQDYYDQGMRVPDDVTLLLCDDNWGNIRKLPKTTDPKRSGGFGIYYHFDYVGGPRNYKWLNTNNIARVWEQMHLAYEHGVDKIWIVNVGDIKPMEFPISFFMDYAWNTKAWNEDNLATYFTHWAGEQFGAEWAAEVGDVLRRYAQLSARRKPELLDAQTYSLTNYNEADRVEKEWLDLLKKAEEVNKRLPAQSRDAFFQVALHPVKAVANLHQLYFAVAKNQRYAAQKNLLANQWADKAKEHYVADSLLSRYYNKELAGGKWSHMMDQTHIGYRSWQEPRTNVMPAVTYLNPDSVKATPAVNMEPGAGTAAELAKGNPYAVLANQYNQAVNGAGVRWKTIPDIGREGDGVTTFPVTVSAGTDFQKTAPHLMYTIPVKDTGLVQLGAYFSTSLNFHSLPEGLQYAVSVDDEAPQILSLNKEDKNSISGIWNTWVANNVIIKTSTHRIEKPGQHVVRYWAVSPGVVLQKLVLSFGNPERSYLGPQPVKNYAK